MPYANKDKHYIHVKKWQDRVRKRYYEYKESRACQDCEKFYPYYVMEFHHVRGTKKFTLARRSASFESKEFMEEMAKCDLLCANCHRIRTHVGLAESVQAPV